jgi:hypothetical protein
MLSFFTDKLAEGYNLESVSKDPHVLAMMKGMGAMFFTLSHSSSIANRIDDKRTQSITAFTNFLVHAGFLIVCYFDMQDFAKMGAPVTGVYVNITMNCVLAYFNYEAWKETGSIMAKMPPFSGQSSMTNCLRLNSGMCLVFGLWALAAPDTMLEQYFNGAPTSGDNGIMLKVIMRTFGYFLLGAVLKNGAMITCGNADAEYYAVRGSAMYWFFCCGSLTQAHFMKNIWKEEAYMMNVVMQFGMFFYAATVMIDEDNKSLKED